jgi:hypothetical protein
MDEETKKKKESRIVYFKQSYFKITPEIKKKRQLITDC